MLSEEELSTQFLKTNKTSLWSITDTHHQLHAHKCTPATESVVDQGSEDVQEQSVMWLVTKTPLISVGQTVNDMNAGYKMQRNKSKIKRQYGTLCTWSYPALMLRCLWRLSGDREHLRSSEAFVPWIDSKMKPEIVSGDESTTLTIVKLKPRLMHNSHRSSIPDFELKQQK